jgi:hypothetical protein
VKARAARDAKLIDELVKRNKSLEQNNKALLKLLDKATEAQRADEGGGTGTDACASGAALESWSRSRTRTVSGAGSAKAFENEAVKAVTEVIRLLGDLPLELHGLDNSSELAMSSFVCHLPSMFGLSAEEAERQRLASEATHNEKSQIFLANIKWTKARIEKLHRAMCKELEANGHEGLGRAAEEVQVALDALGDLELAKAKKDEADTSHSDPDPGLTLRVHQEEQACHARLDMSKNRLKEIKQSML